MVQFGGAAGTLAALGDKGLAVTEELAEELKLGVPVMPWHAQRDNFVEFAGWLSLVTGSLGKMAQDIILMAQTEVGEVGESAEEGRGGSSTMPQKANPITSELIVAAARTNASLLSALHQAQIQEHERATHGWQVEWLTLPQMILLTGGALKHASIWRRICKWIRRRCAPILHEPTMSILAEAAVFALAKAMPRSEGGRAGEKGVRFGGGGKQTADRSRQKAGRAISVKKIRSTGRRWPSPENYLGETKKLSTGC